jgi:hypothetical protein
MLVLVWLRMLVLVLLMMQLLLLVRMLLIRMMLLLLLLMLLLMMLLLMLLLLLLLLLLMMLLMLGLILRCEGWQRRSPPLTSHGLPLGIVTVVWVRHRAMGGATNYLVVTTPEPVNLLDRIHRNDSCLQLLTEVQVPLL